MERRKRSRDFNLVIQAERQRVAERSEELGRRVRKRVVRERGECDSMDRMARAMDGRLAEEHDVPAGEVDIFVRRVERRRVSGQGPVRGWVEIACGKGQARDRAYTV